MTTDSFIREVDEELRGDRMRTIWRRFGPWIIGAAVGVVAVVAINEGWSWWQRSNAAAASDQFYSALDVAEGGDIPGAITALDAVETSGSGGYPILARFREAALLAKDGRTDEAIAAYDGLSTSVTEARVRELALLMAANLLVDRGDVAAVRQRVGSLDVPDNPLRNAAREAIGLAQYSAGDIDAALETFEALIADPQVNQDLAGRVQIYVMQLVAEGAGNPEQRAAAAAAAEGAAAEETAAEETAPAGEPPASAGAPESVGPAPVLDTAPAAEPAAVDEIVPEVPQPSAGPTPGN
jgi:hypothetical protein